MKFEYSKQDEAKECVAFIDNVGDFCFKVTGGFIYLMQDGTGFEVEQDDGSFSQYMQENGARQKFYPGDSITITF